MPLLFNLTQELVRTSDRSCMVISGKLQTILTALHRDLSVLYGERLAHIVLFGSQARGEANINSDIDILVVLKGEVQPGAEISRTSRLVGNLSLTYDVVISCVFVSEFQFALEQSPLMLNVRREGVTL